VATFIESEPDPTFSHDRLESLGKGFYKGLRPGGLDGSVQLFGAGIRIPDKQVFTDRSLEKKDLLGDE